MSSVKYLRRRLAEDNPPVTRSVVMFQGKIPVNCPGYKMSWWFRRMLKYWMRHGTGTVYMAHRYGDYTDEPRGRSCKGYMYTEQVAIAQIYAYLNPHLIQEVPNNGKWTYKFIWKEP